MKIKVREFLQDMRDGAGDAELMEKYGLSAGALATVFNKILETGLLDESELHRRSLLEADTAEVERIRQLPRHYVVFQVPIYDAQNLLISGWVLDITVKGLSVQGIKAREHEYRSLLIRSDEFVDVFPFQFEGKCRWAQSAASTSDWLAGFEITDISPGSLAELKKLIPFVTLGEVDSW